MKSHNIDSIFQSSGGISGPFLLSFRSISKDYMYSFYENGPGTLLMQIIYDSAAGIIQNASYYSLQTTARKAQTSTSLVRVFLNPPQKNLSILIK